jgi:hypothetical protein
MFPRLPPSDVRGRPVEKLVELMREETDTPVASDNTSIPAGFTYLGQFIDHDITFDPVSKLEERYDPAALVNFRTPRFDLDSVYGCGSDDQPFLYDWESDPPGVKLLVGGKAADLVPKDADPPPASEDLPRNRQGKALIGDARNDENVIILQLHLLFIKFHNAVVEHLHRGRENLSGRGLFERAQQLVRWHYQWIVVHEFLPKVVGEAMANAVLVPARDRGAPAVRLEYFKWKREPFIPVEFSGAAFRFGHSMVRPDYGLKRLPTRGAAGGLPLFPALTEPTYLPQHLVIDWERFFEINENAPPQDSQLINSRVAAPLFSVPKDGKVLPRLNLRRGRSLELPSGPRVAGRMGKRPLDEEELRLDKLGPRATKTRNELLRSTPLWYYILREADARGKGGRHLGPVGGRIVAEVLVGLLQGDPSSYLRQKPAWRPRAFDTGGTFGMADLVRIAQQGV